MAGRLLASGQVWVIDCMKNYLDTVSGVYLGLMTNSTTPSEGDQLPSNIEEISPTGSGYNRRALTGWTVVSGVDPYILASTVEFNISGTWEDVNGYFVSGSPTGNDAFWAEVFPAGKTGTKYNGDKILITPKYEQKYYGEV